ncbi:hypothetical protein [Rhizobium binxianense]
MEVLAMFAVQIVMGIVGGQMISTALQLENTRQFVRIAIGSLGGLACGNLIGALLGDGNSFFALLGDAGGGFAGGALATAIVGSINRRLDRR